MYRFILATSCNKDFILCEINGFVSPSLVSKDFIPNSTYLNICIKCQNQSASSKQGAINFDFHSSPSFALTIFTSKFALAFMTETIWNKAEVYFEKEKNGKETKNYESSPDLNDIWSPIN
ncbi:hypothetical protein BpHYR1_006304 [Brachionus plicatilis]|uniref:Uncharacterized protein n=1 Tax=Brachionus plicatilis TaxID=10195 RepID=A0A3M7RLV9_BRAPC|nr:hypothetical protein BpHYR1_006304 [Brachionus plicatilis]